MNVHPSFSTASFRARALAQLLPEPPSYASQVELGDHTLSPDLEPYVRDTPMRPAAVLIPVVTRESGPQVLFTLRAAHLTAHPGQIAFPGGRIDPTDVSVLDAALREAEEEIGLDRRFVEPLGYLDAYLSRTGFRVMPVVALVSPDHTLELNPNEVQESFEVPLSFLMTPDNHETYLREWKGLERRVLAMRWGRHHIWGMTAGIVRNLYERVYGQ